MKTVASYSDLNRIRACLSRSRRLVGAVLVFSVIVMGCDSLLEVDLPGRIPVEDLDDPRSASLLVVSATNDLECAWTDWVKSHSMFVEEIIGGSSSPREPAMSARRRANIAEFGGLAGCNRGGGTSIYLPLQTARYQAEDTYQRITDWLADGKAVADADKSLARMAVNAGYIYTVFGEVYCDMSVAIDGGPLVSKQQLLTSGEEWFTKAMVHAQAASATDLMNLATVGRARARLNRGDGPGAVADATAVDAGFVFWVQRDGTETILQNAIAYRNWVDEGIAVGENYRALEVNSQPDPRVVVTDAGRISQDGQTPLWFQHKYTDVADDQRMASWVEAQFIIAEVQGGQVAVDMINSIRDIWSLPHFASSDPVAIMAQVAEEKRREFYLEGHRMGDEQRFGIPAPTGITHKGWTYADLNCWPLMDSERERNPNIS